MLTKLNIFISYGRKDARDLAFRLRDDLQNLGYSVWLDVEEIPGGASWSEEIEQAIEHCHVALALLSHHSYDSRWCRAEQMRAIRKGKRLIPIRVQHDAERPLYLEHINYLDFSNPDSYDDMFRDLISDITAGQAFRVPGAGSSDSGKSPFKPVKARTGSKTYQEKRNAPAFRRHLQALRREDWLDTRYWWPYFLFHFASLQDVVETLVDGELVSQVDRGGKLNVRWDKFVRLDFRPRTPALFRNEGFRTIEQPAGKRYAPIPIYLLFDLEAVICHPESRFSDGNPELTKKTYKTPGHFQELPFDQIYHDSWFMPDEKDEIMKCREAQVLIPDRLGLESLQFLWLRSPAEYETLRSMLPEDTWQQWRGKITCRQDYHLFNHKWGYVEQVSLSAHKIHIQFHPPEQHADQTLFQAHLKITALDGKPFHWQQTGFSLEDDLIVDVPSGMGDYQVELTLDDDLAYANRFTTQAEPL